MAVSRAPERDRPASGGPAFGAGLTRYDLLLVLIPVALVAAIVAHLAAGLPLRATVTPASLVGAMAIVDAVFLNPPTSGGGSP